MSVKPSAFQTLSKTRRPVAAAVLLLGSSLIPPAAHAVGVEITSTLTEVSAQVYLYGYTLFNDGSLPGGGAIRGFQIQFHLASDPALIT